MATSHIFISYSRRNTDMMLRVTESLRAANFAVWTDENLTAGTVSWKNSIEQAIQSSEAILVLMSPSAKASEWVERELDYAYVLQRRIFPALVEGTQRDSVPFELINMQYVDLRTDFDQGMRHLIRALQHHILQPDTPSEIEVQTSAQKISQTNQLYVLEHEQDEDLLSMIKPGAGFTKIRRVYSRIFYMYLFDMKRFRLLQALAPDGAARIVHSLVTSILFGWVLLWYLLLSFPAANGFLIFGAVMIVYYLTGEFVSVTIWSRTRSSLMNSLAPAMLVLALAMLVIFIGWYLMFTMLTLVGD